jgi:SecD/SecF fusion protein
MTRKNIDKAIAIVVDELVYSAPFVNGEIEGGRADISGGFTAKEAKQLANMMSGGYLPIRLTLIK